MRDIKFRAWNTVRREMEYAYDLYWFEENHVHFNGDEHFILMQFTGLKDRNGKEIYEGDIVINLNPRYARFPQIVEWNDVDGGHCWDPLHVCDGMIDLLEVIGNIYENPGMIRSAGETGDK